MSFEFLRNANELEHKFVEGTIRKLLALENLFIRSRHRRVPLSFEDGAMRRWDSSSDIEYEIETFLKVMPILTKDDLPMSPCGLWFCGGEGSDQSNPLRLTVGFLCVPFLKSFIATGARSGCDSAMLHEVLKFAAIDTQGECTIGVFSYTGFEKIDRRSEAGEHVYLIEPNDYGGFAVSAPEGDSAKEFFVDFFDPRTKMERVQQVKLLAQSELEGTLASGHALRGSKFESMLSVSKDVVDIAFKELARESESRKLDQDEGESVLR
ncbi:MAG: hypothetical protein NUW37_10285 [Planctomycetes bacterium]|nr:hypothetical protein [Planctomycetota bacterium]